MTIVAAFPEGWLGIRRGERDGGEEKACQLSYLVVVISLPSREEESEALTACRELLYLGRAWWGIDLLWRRWRRRRDLTCHHHTHILCKLTASLCNARRNGAVRNIEGEDGIR